MCSTETSKFKLSKCQFRYCCEFEWNIDDVFRSINSLRSPAFLVDNDCPTSFIICLDCNNWKQTLRMNIKLEVTDNSLQKIRFCYEFKSGSNTVKEGVVNDLRTIKSGVVVVLPNYNSYDGWYVNGSYTAYNDPYTRTKLTLLGKIMIDNCQIKPKTAEKTKNEYLLQLQTDFKSLLKNHEFSDVVLKVDKEVVRAHKFVLCARSPVFKRMFEQGFKEAAENSVDITDIKKSVLEYFLEFLYTGVVGDRTFETVTALYSTADKYEVKTLQQACREILISSYLSADKVPIILKLADMHNDDDLKEKAIVFICDNFIKVEPTTEWGNLLDRNPRLASYTLRRVSTKISK